MSFRFILLLLLLLPLSMPAATGQPFERRVEPFAFLGLDSAVYDLPFLGGLNAPRPQFVDIDADGDLDLFVQEEPGTLIFLENTGTAAAPQLAWHTDRFADLDVGAWARFFDLDGDGDLDLLTEQPFSLVRYYRNEGTAQQPAFTLAADTLKREDGTPLRIDRQNVPTLADVTCDGLLDLLVATIDRGTLVLFEGTGVDAAGVPGFRFVTDEYQGIAIIGGFGKARVAAARHGANAITLADLDGDGDLDLLWGDFFSPSLYFIENTGTCAAPNLVRVSDTFPLVEPIQTTGFNAPRLADLDADGDLDLFVGVLGGAFTPGRSAADNFYFYENTGAAQFTLRTRRTLPNFDVGKDAAPALGDLDGDGDLDLLVGNELGLGDVLTAHLALVLNEGTPQAPRFRFTLENFEGLDRERANLIPALGDLDGDGDLDLLAGGFDGSVAFARNDGDLGPSFVLVDSALVTIPRGNFTAPALADIDADGDLDLFVGEASGTLNFYRNFGTPQQAMFDLETETFGGLDAGERSHPAFHDLDGDGDLDLLVGTQLDGLRVYRNDGTPQEASFVLTDGFGLADLPALIAPALADLDGDGDADLLLGSERGGLLFYENRAVVTAVEAPPEVPFRLAVFPNPFRDTASFQFSLAAPSAVRLEVYDVLGRTVAVPVEAFLAAGEHAIRFDAAGLPAGVYFYTLQAGTQRQGGTLVQVR